MKNIDQAVEEIVVQLGLSQEELAQRKAYLEITDADIALLRSIHGQLEESSNDFIESFYGHLLKYPELQSLLSPAGTLARLKRSQSEYFNSLTAGDYGLDYVRNRLRVGLVHQHIGLDPKWYIGAYRKYFSYMMPSVQGLRGDDVQHIPAVYDALLKIVCLDMGLALDTYFEADRQAILQLKNYAEQIIANLPVGLIVVDADFAVNSINAAMRNLLRVGDVELVGMPLAILLPGEIVLEKAAEVCETGSSVHNLIVHLDVCGTERQVEFEISRASLGNHKFLLVIAEDITDRMKAEADLHESEERFRLTFNHAGVGLAHIAIDGRLLRVNQKLQAILGYSEKELLSLAYRDIAIPEELRTEKEFLRRMLANEIQSYAREMRYIHKDGHTVWVHLTVSLVRRKNGEPRYLIAVVEDISERKEAADQLVRLANYDPLTGLPNRALLQDRLHQQINHAARTQSLLAVLFIDLDRFKDINDSMGHDAGDEMLSEISRRLSLQLRRSDTVARLGGDEFVILLQDVSREEEIANIARKILSSLSMPMTINGVEFFPSGSIGISVFPRDGQSGRALLKNADVAMYQAKGKGKNNFQFYSTEMNDRILDRLKVESGLRRAVEKREFAILYQPQIDTASGRVIGVEALLRWTPPGQPPVAPADFIPIAEETGLIVPIGQWVLHEACAQCKRWNDAGLSDLRMTVNLSARQFRHDIAAAVSEALKQTGCQPGGLTLELTESALMESPGLAVNTLRILKTMGVNLAIDDFGTGYSSLNYLSRFPISTLKIDRSFVCDITNNHDDVAIVRAIIALARAMKMEVIAEGVETAEQMRVLQAEHCDRMQGVYFGAPAPAAEVEKMLLRGVAAQGGH